MSRRNGPTRFDCCVQLKMTTRSTRAKTLSSSCCRTARSSWTPRRSTPQRRSPSVVDGGRCLYVCGRVLTVVGRAAASPRCRSGVRGPSLVGPDLHRLRRHLAADRSTPETSRRQPRHPTFGVRQATPDTAPQ